MKMYHTATQKAYDELMLDLEEKGYKWLSGYKPTEFDYWESMKENTCIEISGKYITYGPLEQLKKQHQNTPVIDYKEKGESMLNTECKQCKKKWYNRKAKYCSMCGKKLVSEPEFKSGDIVATMLFADGSFGLVLLNEDLTNHLTYVDGLWYIKRDCTVYDGSLGVFNGETRHATPEEISEYKTALNFHKHVRKPFEIKEGDILLDSKHNIFFINEDIEIWNKEDFISGDFTLLKTAEEVNEWLENK